MKLVNGFDLMEYAKRYNRVLPAFNTTNLEMTYAIADGLMEADLPGYIQISSNNLRLSTPKIIAEIAQDAVKEIIFRCKSLRGRWFYIDHDRYVPSSV